MYQNKLNIATIDISIIFNLLDEYAQELYKESGFKNELINFIYNINNTDDLIKYMD